jgi:hypothetical protein
MLWVGWYRLTERSPWQRGAEGMTLDECAHRLSEATRHLHLKNTDEALTTGAPPSLPADESKQGRRD